MKKGISESALPMLVIFAVVPILVGAISLKYVSESTIYTRTNTETIELEVTNDIEFVKQNLLQALRFSFYQASYDVTKDGGYWRKYQQTFLPDYVKNLQDSALNILNQYVGAIKKPIEVPDFDKVEVKKLDDFKVFVRATADGMIEYQISNDYRTEERSDSADTEEKIKIKTIRLFEIGKEDFIDKDSVGNAIQQAENEMPSECRKINFGDVCENALPDCETELTSKCRDADTNYKNKIVANIQKLEKTEDGISTTLDTKETKAEHTSSQSGTPGGESSSCNCKSGHKETETYSCPTQEDPNKKCTREVFVCDKYYKIVKDVSCNYKYYGAAKVLVKVTDQDKYPVYNSGEKTTDMRNIELSFNVISGNKELI